VSILTDVYGLLSKLQERYVTTTCSDIDRQKDSSGLIYSQPTLGILRIRCNVHEVYKICLP
jgi:hypothetical protein